MESGAAKRQPVGGTVARLGGAFMARRNFKQVRTGDRIIIQTEDGQAEGLVMGGRAGGEIKVRLWRWGQDFTISPEAILRRLGANESQAVA